MIECCFIKTVERLIHTAIDVAAIFHPTLWSALQSHNPNIAATEPIT